MRGPLNRRCSYSLPPPADFAAAFAASMALALSSSLIGADGAGAGTPTFGAGGVTGRGTSCLLHALNKNAAAQAEIKVVFIFYSLLNMADRI